MTKNELLDEYIREIFKDCQPDHIEKIIKDQKSRDDIELMFNFQIYKLKYRFKSSVTLTTKVIEILIKNKKLFIAYIILVAISLYFIIKLF